MKTFYKQFIIAIPMLLLVATIFFIKEYGEVIKANKLESPIAAYVVSVLYTFTFGIWIYLLYPVAFLLTNKFFLVEKSTSIAFSVYGFILAIVYLVLFELTLFFVLTPTHLVRPIQLTDFLLLILSPLGAIYGYLYYKIGR